MSSSESINEASMEAYAPSKSKITYVKAIALTDESDLDKIKDEVQSGNILIVKITPLAVKSIDGVKNAIDHLKDFVDKQGGDIARLGEERIVVTPSTIKIWRKKSSQRSPTESSISNVPFST